MKSFLLNICIAVLIAVGSARYVDYLFTTTTALAQINPSAGGNPCQNPAAILQSIPVTTSGTTAAQIIALSGSTKIFICALTVIGQSGTTPTFSLVQGTGTNCATGQTVVVPAFATPANTLFAFAKPVSVGVAGNALCYLQTGTTPVTKVQITYVQ